MKPLSHSTMLAITAVVSAIALFAAVSKNLNAGQKGYKHHSYYGYDTRYRPPAPPGYQYYAPGMPHRMQVHNHPAQRQTAAESPDNTATPAPTSNKVAIAVMGFYPAVIRVNTGEEVTWTNNATMLHTVTGRHDGKFSSQRMGRGSMFSHTFEQPGFYQYYCVLHPSMTGTVIVE
jgi:plastocyanin